MYSENSVPAQVEFLIEQFDGELVAIAARSGELWMVADRDAEVVLHGDHSAPGGVGLQLGGSSWGERDTGNVRSTQCIVDCQATGRIGESTEKKHERVRNALEDRFGSHDDLYEAFVDTFGTATIISDDRDNTDSSKTTAKDRTDRRATPTP